MAKQTVVTREPNLLAGALAGLAAGLVASFAMSQAQAIAGKLGLDPSADSDEDPATVKAAQVVSRSARGMELQDQTSKDIAGSAVHYVTGTLLGVAYGIAAEYRAETTAGAGAAFGIGTSLLLDEAAVPAAGLSAPPTQIDAGTHLFGLVSHLVYGLAAEATRKGVRDLLDR